MLVGGAAGSSRDSGCQREEPSGDRSRFTATVKRTTSLDDARQKSLTHRTQATETVFEVLFGVQACRGRLQRQQLSRVRKVVYESMVAEVGQGKMEFGGGM